MLSMLFSRKIFEFLDYIKCNIQSNLIRLIRRKDVFVTFQKVSLLKTGACNFLSKNLEHHFTGLDVIISGDLSLINL